MDKKDNYYNEPWSARNVRHIGYSLLSDVRFNNEPVVPKILGETGNATQVQKLSGQDLDEFLINIKYPPETKINILIQVIKQFQEIDKAGYVLFDRHGGNIRIMEWRTKISIRQMDIENLYDKAANCVYSIDQNNKLEKTLDKYKRYHISPWISAINSLAIATMIALDLHGNHEETTKFMKFMKSNESSKKVTLEDLEKALEETKKAVAY